jgi:D-proline reductase (dithiol) PrdB
MRKRHSRLKNKIIAKVITRFPSLAKGLIDAYTPRETEGIPWTPVRKPLSESIVGLVTTAGVHLRSQEPFVMTDPDGDPTYRKIGRDTPYEELMITHDYYDHADADRDINIVLPVERLKEFAREGVIGGVGPSMYSFMGHIVGPHLYTLMNVTAPAAAEGLLKDGVDCVLVTPG